MRVHRRPRTVDQLRHHRWVDPLLLSRLRLGVYYDRHHPLLRVCCVFLELPVCLA